MKRFVLPAFFAGGIVLQFLSSALAECAHCHCECCTTKFCHVICETKKVPKTCYGCKCEDFCIPCRSCCCGSHMECVPDPCDPSCFKPKCITDWIPGCGCIAHRHKLTKTVVEEEKKTYKWVVEDLCDACRNQCDQAIPNDAPPMPEDLKMPPSPLKSSSNAGPPGSAIDKMTALPKVQR